MSEGAPARVGSLVFPGAAFFSAERLGEIVDVQVGKPFDFRRWDEGIARLRREYKRPDS